MSGSRARILGAVDLVVLFIKFVHFVSVSGTLWALMLPYQERNHPGVQTIHQEATETKVTSRREGTPGCDVGHVG